MPNKKGRSTSKRKVQKGAEQFVLVGPVEQIKTLFANVQGAFTILSGVEEPLKKDLAQVSELLEMERLKLTKNSRPKSLGHGLDSLAVLLDESVKIPVIEPREEIEKRVAYFEQILSAGNRFVELINGVVAVLTGEPVSPRPGLAESVMDLEGEKALGQSAYKELIDLLYEGREPDKETIVRDLFDLIQTALDEGYDRAKFLTVILGREIDPRNRNDFWQAEKAAVKAAVEFGMEVPSSATSLNFNKLYLLAQSTKRGEKQVPRRPREQAREEPEPAKTGGGQVPNDGSLDELDSLAAQIEEATQRGIARAGKGGSRG